MCGIIGYIGEKQALPILLKGLHALEYRGYDSAGVAILNKGKISRTRAVGRIGQLEEKIGDQNHAGTMGIGHTRWATHGGVTEANAHPHFAADGKLILVHNGIIENYRELREKLGKSVHYESETDSEVLAHLIAKYYKGNLRAALEAALPKVRGTYGIAVMHADQPDVIVGARLGSPLVIGIAEDGHFLASDATPLVAYTKKVVYLDDGEIVEVSRAGFQISNLKRRAVTKPVEEITWDETQAQKQGYEHFMLKEIFDQPTVLEDAIRGRYDVMGGTAHLGGLDMTEEEIRKIERIIVVACGTAYHSGLIAKYAFEHLAGIPTEVDQASEFRYRDPVLGKNTLVFAVSQSGETLDTLMAMREAKHRGALVRGIVNVIGSTIAREAGAGTYIHAGPEMAVASTKAFTNMVAVLFLYALQFARLRKLPLVTGQRYIQALLEIPRKLQSVLKSSEDIRAVAEKYKDKKNFFFLGRGINYPVALEGSLKLKEIAYVHSEAYPGGEMKHGPLALISKGFPVVAIVTKNQLYEKMKSNVAEVRARGARTIIVATAGDEEIRELADDVIYVPETMELLQPLLNTVPLQLVAYYLAASLGREVDRPRNLAKSVTVE
ncbi:MAG: glutamine--fructose-6-phosphate aminotransferase [Candidatus Doudnabacteria bacterium RIFCSPHIGHO2_01_52_17]|uniref:Glutamine--fructose-6-phosphate aminotransferase [isomerizing] n=1 Tax=Candidatus Doudnabacteria bacterium RIFCSPHIGHO2_01_52_17 TaxID=1817820 RepID=A0A1F5NEH6_9BACT|nr:MAG: glutamine--fructose-6-phosphate aminotransferase [Candidatus Doudnabacteria bacterium RIFCSPHIGHO2_01_52_17]